MSRFLFPNQCLYKVRFPDLCIVYLSNRLVCLSPMAQHCLVLFSACPSSITFSALLGQKGSPSDSNGHHCLTSSHSDDLSFSVPNHLFANSVNTVIKGTLSLLINERCCFSPLSLSTYLFGQMRINIFMSRPALQQLGHEWGGSV